MVYESDFYTSRRPYSSRPNVSSYSVTSRIVSVPTIRKVHSFTTTYPIYSTYPVVRHRTIPYVAHKRLVTGTRISVSRSSVTPTRTISRVISLPTHRAVTPIRFTSPSRFPITPIAVLTSPVRHASPFSSVHSYTSRISTSPTRTTFSIRTRPSILEREYQRIENKVRTRPEHLYTDSYLNSESVRAFDDATKSIRNDTNSLMRKIHTRVARAQSVLPLSTYEAKYEKRYGPDTFVAHLVSPLKSSTYNGLESYNPHKYIAKLDPCRPSRKFSQAKGSDESEFDALKDKQAARAQRLAALTEEMNDDEWTKRKTDFASKILDDESIKAKSADKQKILEEEEERKKQQAKEAERARKEAEKAEQARKEAEAQAAAQASAAQAAAAQAAEAERARKEAAEEAERQRIADEEEARIMEELERERLAAEEAEQKRVAEEAKAAELEKQKALEEAKQAELARIAAEEAEIERQLELERQAEIERQQKEQEELDRIAAEEAEKAEESTPEEGAAEEEEESAENDEEQILADKLAEEERRQQEQKQREIELARLAELEEIASQEREAELARQAAELAELARQQEAEARKQQEEEEDEAAESGPQSSKPNENDDIENEDEVKIHDTVDATDDDAQSVASAEAENSKYESEEETE